MHFCSIPFDIKEGILSLVDGEHDLLQLALTSKEWKALIIPFHIEYRTLRIQSERDRPEVWQHLAENRLLASRIKTVVLGHNFRASTRPLRLSADEVDLYPRTLLRQSTDVGEALNLGEATSKAFANMTSLEVFQWSLDYISPKSEDLAMACFREVFEGIQRTQGVKHLTLSEQRRYGSKRCPDELRKDDHPLWHLRGIETLSLNIFSWINSREASNHFNLFKNNLNTLRSINLRVDVIPPEADILTCTFPNLTSATFTSYRIWNAEKAKVINEHVVDFLVRHSSLEYLSWTPWEPVLPVLPEGDFLPSLKRLSTLHSSLLDGIRKASPAKFDVEQWRS